jgi:hypothetical protein
MARAGTALWVYLLLVTPVPGLDPGIDPGVQAAAIGSRAVKSRVALRQVPPRLRQAASSLVKLRQGFP